MRKIKAIEKENKQRILNVCPNCPETSGIYFFIRKENGFKYAYIGQAKHLLTRISNHLRGFQHIDLSIKKHGLFSESNPCGYTVNYLEFPESMLDEKEQEYILKYANAGYQLRNKTSGSQGEGKKGIEMKRSGRMISVVLLLALFATCRQSGWISDGTKRGRPLVFPASQCVDEKADKECGEGFGKVSKVY